MQIKDGTKAIIWFLIILPITWVFETIMIIPLIDALLPTTGELEWLNLSFKISSYILILFLIGIIPYIQITKRSD